MTWTVRTVQLPIVNIDRSEHDDEEGAWISYLQAIEAAKQRAASADEDLAIGVDLHLDGELVEQHWITLSRGVLNTGRHA